MLLLDVGEDFHMLRSNLLAIPQQVAGAGIEQALIGHVREHKTFRPDEIQTCRDDSGVRRPAWSQRA